MTDIVARLRALYSTHPMVMEAADEIERQRTLHRISIDGRDEIERGLREDNEQLRTALLEIAQGTNEKWTHDNAMRALEPKL